MINHSRLGYEIKRFLQTYLYINFIRDYNKNIEIYGLQAERKRGVLDHGF